MRPATRVLAAGILFTSLLGLMPIVQAAPPNTIETFETDPLFFPPSGQGYTFTYSGASSGFVDSVRAIGSRSYFQQSSSSHFIFEADDDYCDGSLSFAFNLDTFLSGQSVLIGLSVGTGLTGSGNNQISISIADTGTVTFRTVNNIGTVTSAVIPSLTLVTDTWYNVTIVPHANTGSPAECAAASTSTVLFPDQARGVSVLIGAGAGIVGSLDRFTAGTTSGNFPQSWFDNVLVESTTSAATLFCGNLGDPDAGGPNGMWGYEYVSQDGDHDVQELGPGGSISMDDGFLFTGDNDDDTWDYMAKHFNPGSQAFHTTFEVEASVDSTNSVFRVVYSLENSAVPDNTQRGNGIDTLLFDETLEVQLKEVGSDWQIKFYATNPTVASGARTQLGPATNFGDPNDPTAFTFWADTREFADGPPGTGIVDQGPYVAVTRPDSTTPVAILQLDYSGAPSGLNAQFLGDEIFTQWFVGYGDGRLGNGGPETGIDAETGLNDNKADGSESQDSTCVTDDVGTATVGSGGSGTTPGSDTIQPPGEAAPDCSSPFCVDESTVPEGFTVAAFNLFLGILMAAAIAAGFYSLGKSKIAMVVGVSIGLILAFTFGLMPLWPILVIVVVSVAFIFLSTRGVGS